MPEASSAAARGPMTPVETASAGILAGLAIAVLVLGSAFLGGDAGFGGLLAAIPMAMLAHQHRPRVVLAGAVAVAVVASVSGGIPSALGALMSVLAGAAIGWLTRRGAGWVQAALVGLALGVLSALVSIGLMLALPETRELLLKALRASLDGTLTIFHRYAPLLLPAENERLLKSFVAWSIEHWWAYLLISRIPRGVVQTLVGFGVLRGVLRRLRLDAAHDPLVDALHETGEPGPLPVRLTGVSFRYADADRDALRDVDLALAPGETVALVGPNGSGKSTLAHVLAGAAPTAGTVHRPGTAGLGRPGGTALLAQRSELQLLGDTLADDVRWGCAPDEDVDVAGLLDLVGLGGREDESPTTLSGGELQRLALAGALARRPALLVSDESTAMVDPAGRAEVMAVLRSLPARLGTTVVHVTHDPAEAGGMGRMIRLEDGRVVDDVVMDADAPYAPPPPRPAAVLPEPGPVVLTLGGVGHVYSPDTPWQSRALTGIDLTLRAGEGVLVTGTNGSGKSTLARIMAGLLAPSEGYAESVPDKPMRTTVGRVALAMQFSRLQLRRPTVGEDLLDAMNVPSHQPLLPPERFLVGQALAAVGLPPALADRSVDRLSGGQMRRVALAGLLATKPAVLVLDEPFAGLDADSREALTDTLERELRRGLALVVITHDIHGLESLCSRRLVLENGRLA